MIDSHCHLDGAYYGEERASVLGRARQAGVTAFVCVGVGRGTAAAEEASAIALAEPDVFATVGVHPHDTAQVTEEHWATFERLARAPRVVGIGETGLDYHYEHAPREVQQAAYRRSIASGAGRRAAGRVARPGRPRRRGAILAEEAAGTGRGHPLLHGGRG